MADNAPSYPGQPSTTPTPAAASNPYAGASASAQSGGVPPSSTIAYASQQIDDAQTAIDNLEPQIKAAQDKLQGINADSPEFADDVRAQLSGLLDQRASYKQQQALWTPILKQAMIDDAKANGKNLTPQEIATLDAKQKAADADLEVAKQRVIEQTAQTEATKATLALKNDPTNRALEKAKNDADIALTNAQTAAQNASTAANTARAASDQQTAAYEQLIQPYKARSAAAQATTDEAKAGSAKSQETVDSVNAAYAANLADLNLQMQQKNLTYQEFQNRKADLDNQRAQKLLDLGEPAVDVAAKQQALDKASAGTDSAYALQQLKKSVEAGTVDGDAAINQYIDLRSGTTSSERVQNASQNAQNLLSGLLSAGMVVGKGYHGMSPAIGKALGGLGLPSPDLSSDPSTFPAFARNANIATNPDDYLAGMQLPDWLGGGSAPAYAQAMRTGGGVMQTSLPADQLEAMIDAQRAQSSQQGAQAPGAPPVAQAPVTDPGASQPQVEIPQGGPPEAPAPPPAGQTTITINTGNGTTNTAPPAKPNPVAGPPPLTGPRTPPPAAPPAPVPNAPAVPWKDPREQYAPKPIPGPASPGGVPPSFHWAHGGVALLPPYARLWQMPAMAGR